MSFQGKHDFGELNGKRVTFVEKGVTQERMEFLKTLLEHNGLPVVIGKEEPKEESDAVKYTVAVENLLFNPVIWVYERRLKTPDGRIVSPAYWEQRTNETNPMYWKI